MLIWQNRDLKYNEELVQIHSLSLLKVDKPFRNINWNHEKIEFQH